MLLFTHSLILSVSFPHSSLPFSFPVPLLSSLLPSLSLSLSLSPSVPHCDSRHSPSPHARTAGEQILQEEPQLCRGSEPTQRLGGVRAPGRPLGKAVQVGVKIWAGPGHWAPCRAGRGVPASIEAQWENCGRFPAQCPD